MYDLLLTGGTVLDPSQRLHGVFDVAVQDGKIAHLAPPDPSVDPALAAVRVVDVSGKTVTPGLIDLHTHVFDGVASNGVHPDMAGVRAGVTTVVDAGSSGAATFEAFPRHILPHCATEVIPFLHICQTGLATHPDIIAAASINLDATLHTIDANNHLI
jgi:dihydroorotase